MQNTTKILACKEKNKFAIESKLPSRINLDRAYSNIKKTLTNAKYSKELGVIKATKNNISIIIFKTGRITLRKAKTKKELQTLLSTLTKKLEPYFNAK